MSAILFIRSKLDIGSKQTELAILALGTQGDHKAIKKQIDEWESKLK